MKYNTSKQMLLQYLVTNFNRLEGDIIELRNCFLRRNMTVLDCTELSVALAKFEQFAEVFHDILQIYKISDDDIEKYCENKENREEVQRVPRWVFYGR